MLLNKNHLFWLLPILSLCITTAASGQILQDTLFAWKGYASRSLCKVQVFKNPADSTRNHTIVLKEIAENKGRTTIEDIDYLAEQIGRLYSIDPVKAHWIIHWGSFSFRNGEKSRKELFVRVTFRRTSTGRLGAPQWRIISREHVEGYTDRYFR